ncbi:hypothetical protein Tco_0991967 [Tanacetum coccineum]|uniref:Uncharacterized protein n=1 Tax=Tanacetum coccineum TaxID=301880 RepID=A0ABQ5F1I3_9ASTR
MISSSSSRNSSKNMPRFSSNDMVHNHYLDEAKKKTQERDRYSTTNVTPARFQCTTDDSKPKPRSNNQTSRSLPVSKSSRVTITVVPKADHSKSSSSFLDSKQFVCSTCHKCVFNANHDACITKLLKEVNSRAKIQSHKTKNSNKPVDQKNHTQKPGRQIFIGHRFSPNKTFTMYEKTSPRSNLRWKPMGRIFKSVGLRWIPTGKLFDSCTSKVVSELPHGSNVDIPNIYECKQTLDVSAGTSINVQKEQSLDLSAGTLCNVNKENLRETDIQEMDKNEAKNDKTEHENGKSVKQKSKSKPSQQKVKVKIKSKSNPGSCIGKSIKNKLENLNCQKWAHPYPLSRPSLQAPPFQLLATKLATSPPYHSIIAEPPKTHQENLGDKELEKKCKPSISHHREWLKSVHKLSMKKRFGKKESVSKQGRKKSKPESTLDDSTVFDDQDHGIEYMETKEVVDEGRQNGETEEVKLTDDTEVVEDKGRVIKEEMLKN